MSATFQHLQKHFFCDPPHCCAVTTLRFVIFFLRSLQKGYIVGLLAESCFSSHAKSTSVAVIASVTATFKQSRPSKEKGKNKQATLKSGFHAYGSKRFLWPKRLAC